MVGQPVPRRRKLLEIYSLTKGHLWAELRRHKFAVFALLLLSVVLGIIPTFKSELESGFLQQVDYIFHTSHPTDDIWSTKVDRFRPVDDKSDWSERIAHDLFFGTPLRSVFIIYLLLAAVGHWLQVGTTSYKARIQRHLFGRLRAVALKRALALDSSAFPRESNVAAHFSSSVQQGASVIADMYGFFLDGFQHLFSVITATYFVFMKEWHFALIFMSIILVQGTISVIQGKMLRTRRERLDGSRNRLSASTDDILDKRELILAWEQQKQYEEKIDNLADDYAEVERSLDVKQSSYDALSRWLFDLGRVGVLVVALLFAHSQHINVGDAYFLISLYVRLLFPTTNLMLRYDRLKQAESTAATFLRLLALPQPDEAKASADALSAPEIRFEHVKFAYETDRTVLKDCSFTAPAGVITLITGPSGIGKSTIARLLLRFWPRTSGEITIDGKPIDNFSAPELRLLMSYVAQDENVTDDTAFANLTWPQPEPTPKEMSDVLRLLGFADADERLLPTARSAKEWSIGEQQRLAIARVILDRAPIAILDEPLTGIDHARLKGIVELLRETFGGKRTVIMISHQRVFVDIADHVVVLGYDGSVRGEGSRDDVRDLLAMR